MVRSDTVDSERNAETAKLIRTNGGVQTYGAEKREVALEIPKFRWELERREGEIGPQTMTRAEKGRGWAA